MYRLASTWLTAQFGPLSNPKQRLSGALLLELLVQVSEDGLLIELQPVEVTNSMVVLDDGLPAVVPDGPFEALCDDKVRAGIETIREERLSRWR